MHCFTKLSLLIESVSWWWSTYIIKKWYICN